MPDLLETLCAIPTAPFVEHRVLQSVRDWAKEHGLRVTKDATGNLLVERTGRGRGPRLVLVAHADHPGFVAGEMTDRRTLTARFHGYVRPEFFVGSRVRFFDGEAEVVGTVLTIEAEGARPASATLRVGKPVAPGAPGMWDVGGPRSRGRGLSRANARVGRWRLSRS